MRDLNMQPLRILVVEDNRDSATIVAMYFAIRGQITRKVHTSQEVESAVDSFDPHVILMDIGLPDIDGCEIVRRLRSRGCSARIIAHTGYGRAEDIKMARDAGFDRHVIKPADLDELWKVILELTISPVNAAG